MKTNLRAFEKQRRELSKSLNSEIKAATKATKWKFSNGVIFKEAAGWFFSVNSIVYLNQELTEIQFNAKPMAIDPIFWEIFALPDNNKMPLSFRYWGAFTCRCPDLECRRLNDTSRNTNEVAAEITDWADTKFKNFNQETTVSLLMEKIHKCANNWGYFAPEICLLIWQNKQELAKYKCEEAISNNNEGGFTSLNGSFPQMTLEFLSKQKTPREAGS